MVKQYTVGTPCYALYCGPRQDKDPRWVPATVTKAHGSRSVNVRAHPRGAIWRRHLEQLRPRYGMEHDSDPGVDISSTEQSRVQSPSPVVMQQQNPRMPQVDEYGPHNPRRSQRARKPRQF